MIDRPKIKVFSGGGESAEEFYWHLIAKNGEIRCQGEGYSERNDAVEGVLGAAETFLELMGPTVEANVLRESIEIIDADGKALTLEEAGYR